MHGDGNERRITEADEHILLERHLDARWEMESPGIYRLREDRTPEGRTPESPFDAPQRVLDDLLRDLAADPPAEHPKQKRQRLKRLKSKHHR